ncbi:MAG: hypothetical protein TR69_WS6001000213 [candidate division WS6 bacterium OLB20]|uniref:Uncharacterized protein n=1 Tax=candidate division WS6 bacterium OLB20 TaxID=1617426 RepID=A0A136M0A7_9BACT|nr:MAG: hypothetical protein TR69_WS6001000213 [candidate division WS6 bacterium OLB20]
MNDKKTAFVPSSELNEKLKRLQEEMHLGSAAEVISLALSMLEISLGREVEVRDSKHSYRISKFSRYNQTVTLDDDDNGSSD